MLAEDGQNCNEDPEVHGKHKLQTMSPKHCHPTVEAEGKPQFQIKESNEDCCKTSLVGCNKEAYINAEQLGIEEHGAQRSIWNVKFEQEE